MHRNWIDRAIEYIDPKWGADRARNRAYLALVGSYEGGRRDKRATRNWRPSQTSVNEDLHWDLPHLRARSRDLVRNVPLAAGAISTVETNVVGDGLVLRAQIDADFLGITEEAADEWERAAEREFNLWACYPDFGKRLNWDELQSLVCRSVLESGDLLVVRRRRYDGDNPYGLKLQLVEADRLSNPNYGQNTPTLWDGVEMDSDGAPVAYHISTKYPDDTRLGERTWRRFGVGRTVTGTPLILHLYDMKRVDQVRGIPYLAPVIESIKQLSNYQESEVAAAVINAMFTAFIKPQTIQGDGDEAFIGTSSDANVDPTKEIELGRGAIIELRPGEDVAFADPKRPSTAFDAFVTAFTRQIGVALDLPFEVLVKHFTASYSASRAALEMAWQFFKRKRCWLAWKFCQPVYEWVITEAIVTGRLTAPGFFEDPLIREAYLGATWIGPSRIQIDPLKEAKADETDLAMGTKTREDIIIERTGGDWRKKHAQLAIEQAARDEDGLTPVAKPAPGEEVSSGEDKEEDEEDDSQADKE